MKRFRKPLWIAGCTGLLLFACVTINIYFPAEKVESVAGEIVDDVRGRTGQDQEGSPGKQEGALFKGIRAGRLLGLAWAQEVTDVSNPTIRALKERMKQRYQQMKPYYEKGLLKEQDDGYLTLTGAEKLGLKERRDVKNLVEAENEDRKTLYREVAKALNIDPSQVDRVAEIFAKEWQE